MAKYTDAGGKDIRFLGPPIKQNCPPTRHPPVEMYKGQNLSGVGLGCCNTAPVADTGLPASGQSAAPGFDFNALPDWVKWGGIALVAVLLLKK